MPRAPQLRVGWGALAVVACVALAGCTRSEEVQGDGRGIVEAASKQPATTEAPDPATAVTSAEVVDPPGGVPWIPLDPPPLPSFSIVGMSGDRLVVLEEVPDPTPSRGEYRAWTVPRAAVHDPADGWRVLDGCEAMGGCDRLHDEVAVSSSPSALTLVLRRSPATAAGLTDPAVPVVHGEGGELVIARLDLDAGTWELLATQPLGGGGGVWARRDGVRSDDATIVLEQPLDDGWAATWEITGGELRAGPVGATSSIDPNVWELVSGTTTFRIVQTAGGREPTAAQIVVERVQTGGEVAEIPVPESPTLGQYGLNYLADGRGGLVVSVDSSTGKLSRELWYLAPGAMEWTGARGPGWPAALSDTAVVVRSDRGLFQHPLPFEEGPDLLGAAVQGPWAEVGLQWSRLAESSRSAADAMVSEPPSTRRATGHGYGGVEVDYVVGDPGQRDRLEYAGGEVVEVGVGPSSDVEQPPAVEGRMVLAVPDNQGTHKFWTVDPDGTVREVYALQPTEHPMVMERPTAPGWECRPGSGSLPRLFATHNVTVVLAGCGRLLLWLGWEAGWEDLGLPSGAEVVAVDQDVVLAHIGGMPGDSETQWLARRIP